MMSKKKNGKNPLGEVFGFPITNASSSAHRYRLKKLCPFNNKVPNCTKDRASNPLGVCSVIHKETSVITCPIRFREDWLIVENAAEFAFGPDANWTSVSEIKLADANGQSAGNIDFVLITYDDFGNLTDFTSLEVQGVYISGNIRKPFEDFIRKPDSNFKWPTSSGYPKPDFLSSSRKRLIPQMLYKGGIFQSWKKKQSVALQKAFFETLPSLPTVPKSQADIAWFLYDLIYDENTKKNSLQLIETIYTEFDAALAKVTTPVPGDISNFIEILQSRLSQHLDKNPPDAPSLSDIMTNQ